MKLLKSLKEIRVLKRTAFLLHLLLSVNLKHLFSKMFEKCHGKKQRYLTLPRSLQHVVKSIEEKVN